MRDRPPGKLRHRELDAFGLECDRDRPRSSGTRMRRPGAIAEPRGTRCLIRPRRSQNRSTWLPASTPAIPAARSAPGTADADRTRTPADGPHAARRLTPALQHRPRTATGQVQLTSAIARDRPNGLRRGRRAPARAQHLRDRLAAISAPVGEQRLEAGEEAIPRPRRVQRRAGWRADPCPQGWCSASSSERHSDKVDQADAPGRSSARQIRPLRQHPPRCDRDRGGARDRARPGHCRARRVGRISPISGRPPSSGRPSPAAAQSP
jgi:hypothetical protein